MKYLSLQFTQRLDRAKLFIKHNILHADDPPHKLALGIAIGLFVAFLPFLGVKTILAIGLSWLCGGNKAVCIPMVWVSNPVTIVPMSYPGYRLGCVLFQQTATDAWIESLKGHETWVVKASNLIGSFAEVALPLVVGCALVASIAGITSYFLSLALINWYRKRMPANP